MLKNFSKFGLFKPVKLFEPVKLFVPIWEQYKLFEPVKLFDLSLFKPIWEEPYAIKRIPNTEMYDKHKIITFGKSYHYKKGKNTVTVHSLTKNNKYQCRVYYKGKNYSYTNSEKIAMSVADTCAMHIRNNSGDTEKYLSTVCR